MKKIRLALAIIIFTVSLSLLIWGFWPAERETRVQPISPSEMQLPTPQSLRFDGLSASLSPLYPAA
ncbi:MAG: hypothetical protein HZB19_18905 [Chloroflexi bacterium]|nr:hypothetical protein [Chloroflexota bacterium]